MNTTLTVMDGEFPVVRMLFKNFDGVEEVNSFSKSLAEWLISNKGQDIGLMSASLVRDFKDKYKDNMYIINAYAGVGVHNFNYSICLDSFNIDKDMVIKVTKFDYSRVVFEGSPEDLLNFEN
jgi:hypothetical protein